MMKRAEALDATESILRRAGFQLSERCIARRCCFDFAVRRRNQLAFVKVPVNIGGITLGAALELQTISKCFLGAPLFVGNETRGKPLEDDTVYSRYNVYTITVKTLEDIVCRQMRPLVEADPEGYDWGLQAVLVKGEMRPLVEAGPGGCYVNLNGDTIRKRRQELGLSVGKLAEMVGVSRRTLYGYEKGMAKASISVAYNLEWILGIPVVKPIDVFQGPSQPTGFFATAKRIIIKSRFLNAVLRKFIHFDVRVSPTERAPFDFIAQFPDEKISILGGVTDRKEQNIDQRTKEIMSVSEVVEAQPIFITCDEKQVSNNDIPQICYREFMEIKHPKELIARL